MKKLKMLLLGDNAIAPYHPLKNVESILKEIFNPYGDLFITDDYKILESELESFDVLICYSDRSKNQLNAKEVQAVMSYVSNGGRILMLHAGISIAKETEIIDIVGARFTKHPPIEKMTFILDKGHPIGKGINTFELIEEPYQYEVDEKVSRDVFMTYSYKGESYEAGWTTQYGQGTLVYLHPGHNERVFLEKTYQKVIGNALEWLFS